MTVKDIERETIIAQCYYRKLTYKGLEAAKEFHPVAMELLRLFDLRLVRLTEKGVRQLEHLTRWIQGYKDDPEYIIPVQPFTQKHLEF